MKNDFPSNQLCFFQRPIDLVEICPKSLDEISLTLLGIQEIYKDKVALRKILGLVRSDIEGNKTSKVGPSGISIWEIFVLLIIRRTGVVDYHKLSDLGENHLTLREILGHGLDAKIRYPVSTLHDNITKIKPQTIDEINEIIVKYGHTKCSDALNKVRADSFVFEVNIHLHADYKSLVDGTRCLMREGNRLAILTDCVGFRKWKDITKKSKTLGYKITQLKRSKKRNKEEDLKKAYIEILDHTNEVMDKIFLLLEDALKFEFPGDDEKRKEKLNKKRNKLYSKIIFFASGTCLEHELTYRRNILGDTLSAKEKIYSLFDPSVELIMKGKGNKPVEYGHLVYVAQDSQGFMLTGTRMESGSRDKDVCILETKKLQERFDNQIKFITYDKGFFTPENKALLEELVDDSYFPSKGKMKSEEKTEDLYKKKDWHSGVESAINAIEQGNNMGLCRDKGLPGFDRCVAGSIAARNLHTLGKLRAKQMIKEENKSKAAA